MNKFGEGIFQVYAPLYLLESIFELNVYFPRLSVFVSKIDYIENIRFLFYGVSNGTLKLLV